MTNRLRILLILPFPLNKRLQRTNHLRYLLFPLTKIQRTNCLRILCLNTLEDTSFVAQVEGTSTWVVILRTRDDTSLVDQFKWRVRPLDCSKRTREGTSLVDLWLVKDFTRLKEISRTVGCLETGCSCSDWVEFSGSLSSSLCIESARIVLDK
ncbi:hypothetical protein HKD37_10G028468 [Glycine soja]